MGTIDQAVGYRFHVFLIPKDKNRAEHGFHAHVMKGNRTYFRIDLDSLTILDPIPSDMKKGDVTSIKWHVRKNREQLKQRAKEIRNK